MLRQSYSRATYLLEQCVQIKTRVNVSVPDVRSRFVLCLRPELTALSCFSHAPVTKEDLHRPRRICESSNGTLIISDLFHPEDLEYTHYAPSADVTSTVNLGEYATSGMFTGTFCSHSACGLTTS